MGTPARTIEIPSHLADGAALPAPPAKVFLTPHMERYVIAQALCAVPLRAAFSPGRRYALVWRSYSSGRRTPDDGRMWLLERVDQDAYVVCWERHVAYAMQAAVSEAGVSAWLRSDTHRRRDAELAIVSADGSEILPPRPAPSGADSLTLSGSGAHLAVLSGADDRYGSPHLCVWDVVRGEQIADFPILLTGGRVQMAIDDTKAVLLSASGAKVEIAFDGEVLLDERFERFPAGQYAHALWTLRTPFVASVPKPLLAYALDKVTRLIDRHGAAAKTMPGYFELLEIRANLQRVVGTPAQKPQAIDLRIDGSLARRLSERVATGEYGSDVETVALKLLDGALGASRAR